MLARERIVRLLLRILTHPRQYTRQQLADYFNVHKTQINKDIDILNSLSEITVKYRESPYLCYIEANNRYNELSPLHPLTEEEKGIISQALHHSKSTKKAEQLLNKIAGLYDFQQLGLEALRHPAIERINRLEGAKNAKKQVILKRYRSNNNSIKDRRVEGFLINPELDTLQAFDYARNETRHFRLSRIERVELLDKNWENETKHRYQYTDVFRIANNKQVMVKLKLRVQAYNILIEHYPMAAGKTDPAGDADFFIFQDKVNARFLGLTNFIMGYAKDIEILAPASLQDHIKTVAKNLLSEL